MNNDQQQVSTKNQRPINAPPTYADKLIGTKHKELPQQQTDDSIGVASSTQITDQPMNMQNLIQLLAGLKNDIINTMITI